VRRAARLASCLARYVERVGPGDPTFVWAVGRADEVRTVVGASVREWSEGRVDAVRAADRIHGYAQELEDALSAYERSARRSESSVVETRPRFDTAVDL
jgi:hypothetical protein